MLFCEVPQLRNYHSTLQMHTKSICVPNKHLVTIHSILSIIVMLAKQNASNDHHMFGLLLIFISPN
uniref:Uncharacterized protein n=1 Tax=Arundo donax TaxID=35708 RepID=A0A0A9ALA8_ARUDO